MYGCKEVKTYRCRGTRVTLEGGGALRKNHEKQKNAGKNLENMNRIVHVNTHHSRGGHCTKNMQSRKMPKEFGKNEQNRLRL